MIELQRFISPVDANRLPSTLRKPKDEPSESLGIYVELDGVLMLQDQLVQEGPGIGSAPAEWDAPFARALHKAMKPVPRRFATDMRLWHWLCCLHLQDFVWLRWHGSKPENSNLEATLENSRAMVGHFGGAGSLHGVSRNAAARLYWCAESLWSPEEKYRWVDAVLSRQQSFTHIFERRLGLYQPAAIALLRSFEGKSEKDLQGAAKRLNHYATTVVLETLDEEDIASLADE